MTSADETPSPPAEKGETTERRRGRARRLASASRALLRVVYRDPEHVSERMTLYAVDRLGDSAREWAESVRRARPDTPRAELAEELRLQTAHIARIDGAVSGTPFLIAFIPGYVTYLWQEMVMTLRTAALYDHDPRSLATASEMLALRGVHPTTEKAQAALVAARDTPVPEKPPQRRPLRKWIDSGFSLLVFGGFMHPSTAKQRKGKRQLLRDGLGLLVAGAIWVITWVLPFTFMIVMAWGCEIHARQLGRRVLIYYGGEASVNAAIAAAQHRRDHGHDKRAILRGAALFVSVAIPIGFVAYVTQVRNSVGINWLGAIGALVAASLVVATVVLATRR
jgi:hypothetical protein